MAIRYTSSYGGSGRQQGCDQLDVVLGKSRAMSMLFADDVPRDPKSVTLICDSSQSTIEDLHDSEEVRCCRPSRFLPLLEFPELYSLLASLLSF